MKLRRMVLFTSCMWIGTGTGVLGFLAGEGFWETMLDSFILSGVIGYALGRLIDRKEWWQK